MEYHTFEISIISSGTKNRYQIFARSKQGDEKTQTTIDLKSHPLKGLLKQLEEQTISDERLQELGTLLYQSLFVGKINTLFNRALVDAKAKGGLGLQLRLNIAAPELNDLPWELLYYPDHDFYLATSSETSLSRYLTVGQEIHEMNCPERLRILAVIPQSSGLNTEPEKDVLRAVEKKLGSKVAVDFLEGPATPQSIREALRQHDYHILHYAGHGVFRRKQGFLMLDFSAQSQDYLSAEQFANFFVDYHSMRLVVLNACQGAKQSKKEELVGIAPQLVKRGVPAVIAMQDSIRDRDAVLFATEFYTVLCHERHGGQVELAISRARNALFQDPSSQVNAFALPVLFLRAPDGKLWDIKPSEEIVVPIQNPASMPAPEILSLHSAIKQLLPYTAEDADLFLKLQRRVDLEQCLRVITDPEFRLGVLLGESGCGKTSFLQAGLIPMLTKSYPSIRPIYVKFSNEEPLTSIRLALMRETKLTEQALDPSNFRNTLAKITAARQQTLLLLFDQFEQFFVHFPAEEQQQPLISLLVDWYQHGASLPVKIVFSYREDFYSRHVDLQQAMGAALPAQDIFYLKKFTPKQASAIFRVLAETVNLPFDESFIREMCEKDLAKKAGERISPVDIQILSWMIANQKESGDAAFTRKYYQQMGGIEGLLENYLSDSFRRVATESQRQLYFKVLLALIDENVRAGVLTLEQLQAKLKGAATAEQVKDAVDWLAHSKTRLITPVKREDSPGGYELAHEKLILPIRKLTHKLSTEIEQANMLLDKRTNEWLGNEKNSHYLLRWRELQKISKQQKLLTWGDNEQYKKQLIAASRRRQRNKILLTMSFIFCLLLAVFSKTTIIPHIQSQQRIKKLGLEFVAIPGGRFEMGDLFGDSGMNSDELPVHPVTLSDFSMGKTEVTNAQFAIFLTAYGKSIDDNDRTMIYQDEWGLQKDSSGWRPQAGYENHPVVAVTWYGAAQFAKWAGCRLPTEAEWEYAAREKGKKMKWSGTSNDSLLGDYAWFDRNSDEHTHPVKTKQPNDLGLYDMSGNVWEWCADWYEKEYYKECYKQGIVDNPTGPKEETGVRVLRGGSWSSNENGLRCSDRGTDYPGISNSNIGFRVVR